MDSQHTVKAFMAVEADLNRLYKKHKTVKHVADTGYCAAVRNSARAELELIEKKISKRYSQMIKSREKHEATLRQELLGE